MHPTIKYAANILPSLCYQYSVWLNLSSRVTANPDLILQTRTLLFYSSPMVLLYQKCLLYQLQEYYSNHNTRNFYSTNSSILFYSSRRCYYCKNIYSTTSRKLLFYNFKVINPLFKKLLFYNFKVINPLYEKLLFYNFKVINPLYKKLLFYNFKATKK